MVSGCLGQDGRNSITIAYEVSPNMVDPGLSPQIGHMAEIYFDITMHVDSKGAMDSEMAMLRTWTEVTPG